MKFLSDEWTAALVAPATATPGGFSGTVLAVVTGGPDGEVRLGVTYEGGHPTAAAVGGTDDPEVTVTLTYADARGVLDGTEDLNALFMAGRMKVAGDATGPLLDLLKSAKAPERVAARADLAAATD